MRSRRRPRGRLIVLLLAGLASAAGAAGAAGPGARPPAPVPLHGAAGQALLSDALRVDHAPLSRYYERQRQASWCGIASGAMVLNAGIGHRRWQQQTLYAAAPAATGGALRMRLYGLSLTRLAQLLREQGAEVEIHRAPTLPALRALVTANLAHPGDYLIANYDRATLGQRGGGHISPVSAYAPAEDRVLLLDVADAGAHVPAWVRLADLQAAMGRAGGQTRGLLQVRPPARAARR